MTLKWLLPTMAFSLPVQAMEWVTVGSTGNPPDDEPVICCDFRVTEPPDPAAGSVPYVYQIGRYEVTNSEWVEFLNAVAATDPNGIYHPYDFPNKGYVRSGTDGPYAYASMPGREELPAVGLDWYRAARYANWWHNGRPNGPQDSSTTEDGAYDLSLGDATPRKPGAKFWIPNEDEWYKAAFYDPVSGTYSDYALAGATRLSPPFADAPGGLTPAANWCPGVEPGPEWWCDYWNVMGPGGPNALTPVGAYGVASSVGMSDGIGNALEIQEDRYTSTQPGFTTLFVMRGTNAYPRGPDDNSSAARNYGPVCSDGYAIGGMRLAGAAAPSRRRACGLGAECALLTLLTRRWRR